MAAQHAITQVDRIQMKISKKGFSGVEDQPGCITRDKRDVKAYISCFSSAFFFTLSRPVCGALVTRLSNLTGSATCLCCCPDVMLLGVLETRWETPREQLLCNSPGTLVMKGTSGMISAY